MVWKGQEGVSSLVESGGSLMEIGRHGGEVCGKRGVCTSTRVKSTEEWIGVLNR